MKYLKTYKIFESNFNNPKEYQEGVEFPDFKNMKLEITESHDLKECAFEYSLIDTSYYSFNERIKHEIKFTSNGIEYREFEPKMEDNYIIRYICSKFVQFYESDHQDVIDSLFYVIVDSCLNNLDTLIEGINNILDNVNESEEQRITRLSIKNINFMFKMYIKFRDEIETSYKYQKYLLDKGDLIRLSKIKKLNPKIEPMVTDVKKQTEWS